MSNVKQPLYKCPYFCCGYRGDVKYNFERHLQSKALHSHEGLEFKIVCNCCNKAWFTGAFDKKSVMQYLDPATDRKPMQCMACVAKTEKITSKKRKRRTNDELIDKMLVTIDHPVSTNRIADQVTPLSFVHTLPPYSKCLDTDAMRGVEMKELKEHFSNMPAVERNKLDFDGVFVANCPNGRAKLYVPSPNGGGGADIHPSVREFWHTVIFKGQPHDLIHEEDLNNIQLLYSHYKSFYANEPGFVRKREDFFEQSFKLKRVGKPILQRLGLKHFKVAAQLGV